MKVALRDDDTSFFTAPEAVEAVYRDIWDRIPVCLAVVPFAIGYPNPGIPKEHWRSGRACPLAENPSLVARLREWVTARRVSIALHGYSHQDYPDGYEFQAAPDPERRVAEGLAYLQGVLDTRISIFVPPHNALSKRGIAAVSSAGLNLLGSFLSFRPSMRPWETRTLGNYWRLSRFRAATGRGRRDPLIYPHVLRYRHHGEFGCHSLIPATTLEELTRGFDEARACGGHFCIATHHWEIDRPMHGTLTRFLDYAAGFGDVQFVAAEQLFA